MSLECTNLDASANCTPSVHSVHTCSCDWQHSQSVYIYPADVWLICWAMLLLHHRRLAAVSGLAGLLSHRCSAVLGCTVFAVLIARHCPSISYPSSLPNDCQIISCFCWFTAIIITSTRLCNFKWTAKPEPGFETGQSGFRVVPSPEI